MEREQKALNAFVHMHAHKATQPKDTRVAHLAHFHPSGMPLDTVLTQYTIEDLASVLDCETHLSRWLMRQVQTYDLDKEHVVGLLFENGTALAHVVQKRS